MIAGSTSNSSAVHPVNNTFPIDIEETASQLKKEHPLYFHSFQSEIDMRTLVSSKTTNELFLGLEDGTIIVYDIKFMSRLKELRFHKQGITGLKVSASDKFLLSSSEDSNICLIDIKNKSLIGMVDISPANTETICFTENEEFACVGSSDGVIRIINFYDSAPPIQLKGHKDGVMTILALNSLTILSSSNDKTLKMWDLYTKTEVSTFYGHTSWINCFVISNKKELIASGSTDNTVRLWSIKKIEEVACLIGHTGEIYSLAINNTDTILASGSQDKSLRIWDLKTKSIKFIQDAYPNLINFIIIPKDSDLVISSSFNSIYIENLEEKRTEVILEGHSKFVLNFILSPDNKKVISISDDKTMKFWGIADNEEKDVLEEHTINVSCLFVSTDNLHIISGGWDCLVIVWKIKEKKPLHILKGHNHYVSCIEPTSDIHKAISGSWDNSLKIWDIKKGKLLHTCTGHTSNVFGLVVSKENELFVSVSGDYKVIFWSLNDYSELFSLSYKGFTTKVEILSNSLALLSTFEGNFQSYNLKKNKIELDLKFESGIISFTILPDHSKLILFFIDKTVSIWDFKNIKELKKITGYEIEFPFICHSLSDSCIAFATIDCQLRIFDINKYTEINSFISKSGIAYGIMTKCKSFFIAGTNSGEIIAWNLIEKRVEVSFQGHSKKIESLVLTKDEVYLVSCSKDAKIKLWKIKKYLEDPEAKISDDTLDCGEVGLTEKTVSLKLKETRELNSKDYLRKLYPALMYNGFKHRFVKKQLPIKNDCKIVFGGKRNLAHIYCYLGYYSHLQRALELGCKIRRDSSKNSPLHYAIEKNSQKCADIILEFMISLSKKEEYYSNYIEFNYALRDDIYKIIKLKSLLTPLYLESIFIVSTDKLLPTSINDFTPPLIIFSDHTRVSFDSFLNVFGSDKKKTKYEIFVEFRTTTIEFNLSNGSSECYKLYDALSRCKNHEVFTTSLVRTILDFKFNLFRRIIYFLSFVLVLNLFLMIACITDYQGPGIFSLAFVTLNWLMLVHECFQFSYEGLRVYFSKKSNLIDILGCILTILWITLNYFNSDLYLLKWLMVFTNFIKGLNIFKAFDSTRFYISLITRAVKETYSFLIIFSYTTFGFGALYIASINEAESPFIMLWKVPYELNFGVFNTPNNFSIEYVYFILASLFNIIMMLNLLIAILGDSFDKFQIDAVELDYIEKLNSILDVECIYLMVRTKERKGFLQLCNLDMKDTDIDVWGGKIKEIEIKIGRISKEIKEDSSRIEGKIDNILGILEKLA